MKIFCDCDGILLRRWRKRQGCDMKAMSGIFNLFEKVGAKDSVVFVTDRPAGILPPLVYQFHGARYHAGENGSVIYDRDTNAEIVDPTHWKYSRNVRPMVVDLLQREIGLDTPEGPWQEGGRQVGIAIETQPGQEELVNGNLAKILAPLGVPLQIGSGSAPCIYPKGVDKRLAFSRLSNLYPRDNGPWYWIADNDRDIPFGEEVLYVGGTVCGVGNSSARYTEFVRENGGIFVNGEYEEGLLQILQQIFDAGGN